MVMNRKSLCCFSWNYEEVRQAFEMARDMSMSVRYQLFSNGESVGSTYEPYSFHEDSDGFPVFLTEYVSDEACIEMALRHVNRLNILTAQYGVDVIINFHSFFGRKQEFQPGTSNKQMRIFHHAPSYEKQMLFMTTIARELKNNSRIVGIDILNEPDFNSWLTYNNFNDDACGRIRDQGYEGQLIIEGRLDDIRSISGIDIKRLKNKHGSNISVSGHFYYGSRSAYPTSTRNIDWLKQIRESVRVRLKAMGNPHCFVGELGNTIGANEGWEKWLKDSWDVMRRLTENSTVAYHAYQSLIETSSFDRSIVKAILVR